MFLHPYEYEMLECQVLRDTADGPGAVGRLGGPSIECGADYTPAARRLSWFALFLKQRNYRNERVSADAPRSPRIGE